MARLSYLGSRIPEKQNWYDTPEGYRIYTQVPICRTGSQEYVVGEISGHPDFNPGWNLNDYDFITLHRPESVVTALKTIGSFEGKSVTDEHPDEDPLVFVDTEDKYGRGHIQNVRVGEALDSGEIPLFADLFIKNQELNDKITAGIREVSCGYTFRFTRDEAAGRFVVTEICGNHLAVVPKGRAGSEVAIRDSANKSIREPNEPEEKEQKKEPMKTGNIWGRMLKAFAVDANPEDMTAALAEMTARDAAAEEKPDEDKKSAQDADMESRNKLSASCDALKAAVDALTAKLGAKDADKEDDKDEKKDKSADDANVLELDPDEQGEPVLGKQIGDATALKAFMATIKPAIAASKNKAAKDAYNAHVRALNGESAVDTEESVYRSLATTAAKDAIDDFDPKQLFNGVPYPIGLKRYQEHIAQKGKK